MENAIRFFIILSVLCWVVPSGYAADETETAVAKITAVSGTVTVTGEDEREKAVVVDMDLNPGDTLVTGGDGRVSFTFNRGDTFRLYENSQLALDELSGQEADTQPVLRLNLGHLWTKIQKFIFEKFNPAFHTPTAVLGVRGTEFDTVVAMDASSAITVDQGAVEVEAETGKVVVSEGMATEVDIDQKITAPTRAIPREKRNWQKWRHARRESLIRKLPEKSPRIRRRFETAANRALQFAGRIGQAADRLNDRIRKVKSAVSRGDRQQARREMRQINTLEKRYRQHAAEFRKGLNRLRVIGKHSVRLETFVQQNLDRFPPDKTAAIRSDLAAISKKRTELRETIRSTIAKIRRTYRNLRALKQFIQRQRKKGGQQNPGSRPRGQTGRRR